LSRENQGEKISNSNIDSYSIITDRSIIFCGTCNKECKGESGLRNHLDLNKLGCNDAKVLMDGIF